MSLPKRGEKAVLLTSDAETPRHARTAVRIFRKATSENRIGVSLNGDVVLSAGIVQPSVFVGLDFSQEREQR